MTPEAKRTWAGIILNRAEKEHNTALEVYMQKKTAYEIALDAYESASEAFPFEKEE